MTGSREELKIIETVAELAGHADASFLERTYCHPQMDFKNQAAQVMTNTLLHSA